MCCVSLQQLASTGSCPTCDTWLQVQSLSELQSTAGTFFFIIAVIHVCVFVVYLYLHIILGGEIRACISPYI